MGTLEGGWRQRRGPTNSSTACGEGFPYDSISNADYRFLIYYSLLGETIRMNRQPVIQGGKSVTAEDGSKGVFIDLQPENEATLRWRNGVFTEADQKFAAEWREQAKNSDLEGMKNALPKPESRLQSLEQVMMFLDFMLNDEDSKTSMLVNLQWLNYSKEQTEKTLLRWKWDARQTLPTFAPYAFHCMRAHIVFCVGMIHGVFGTRATNALDLQYLHCTPFASIFCSGDKLHKQLASALLAKDQTFIDGPDLVAALKEPNLTENSLIWKLWVMHWGKPPIAMDGPSPSKDEVAQMMEEMKPVIAALRKVKFESKPRFPT